MGIASSVKFRLHRFRLNPNDETLARGAGNPNDEIRNPNQIPMTQIRMKKGTPVASIFPFVIWSFGHWGLIRHSDFVIRISAQRARVSSFGL